MIIGTNAIQRAPSKRVISLDNECRVFVVGDLDGDLPALEHELNKVNFDPQIDVLFCLGDFVDRGEQTPDLFTYLQAINAFMVLGNHEHLMLESLLSNDKAAYKLWTENGGNWHKSMSNEKLKIMCKSLLSMPLSIILKYRGYKIGLSHTFPQVWDWNNYPDDKSTVVESLLWDRNVVKHDKIISSEGVDLSIHGHNSTERPFWVGNSYHIDTNYLAGKPTLLEFNELIKSITSKHAL